MTVLVAYATKHGATQGLAERIAKTLTSEGVATDVRALPEDGDVGAYEAYVVGSAVYMGHWRKQAVAFVRRHEATLVRRPVWLFSSGPLGTVVTDAKGRDLRSVATPKEGPELEKAVHPRDHRVFFGALDPQKLTVTERSLRKLPAARAIMPAGDFRAWPEVDEWARDIAHELSGGAGHQG
ncbi:MAG: flavodoxin domain-containing protein [Acidimicrobiales bacterium]